MSWLEKVNTQMTITCGDGKKYTPQYLNSKKAVEFNIAKFNFPDIAGTLVKRRKPMGRVFPVEIIFQGEDHLDVASAFETSANDERPWIVSHPYYGQLNVQPASLEYDNRAHNVSIIQGNLLETIDEVKPSSSTSPVDQVIEKKAVADESLAQAYANNVTPTGADVQDLTEQNQSLYASGQSLATGELGSEYFNVFNEALSAITQATSQPLSAMRKVQSMITAPAQFQAAVKDRIRVLTEQFQNMINALPTAPTVNNKRQFQASGGTMMTTTAEAAVSSDYSTTTEVLQVITSILNNYNSFIETLDSLQSANAGSPTSYIPDFEAMLNVDDVVNEAVSSLFEIALNAQQERSVILAYDSNPIELAHRFYGLDVDDENLVRFIQTNNLSLSQHLIIRANTRIIYYV